MTYFCLQFALIDVDICLNIVLNFSCLCLQLPFSERWRLLEDEIIRPRYYEKKQFESGVKSNPMYKYDMELFSVPKSTPAEISCSIYVYSGKYIFLLYLLIPYQVRRKDFWLLSTVTKLLKEFIPSLSHDADGLIFQVGLPSIQGNGCIVIGEVRMH